MTAPTRYDAEAGIEVIVARNGQPVAGIVPWRGAPSARVPGAWAGRVIYDDDVVGSDDETVKMFDESAEADGP